MFMSRSFRNLSCFLVTIKVFNQLGLCIDTWFLHSRLAATLQAPLLHLFYLRACGCCGVDVWDVPGCSV